VYADELGYWEQNLSKGNVMEPDGKDTTSEKQTGTPPSGSVPAAPTAATGREGLPAGGGEPSPAGSSGTPPNGGKPQDATRCMEVNNGSWFVEGKAYFEYFEHGMKGDIRAAEKCFEGFLMDGKWLVNLGVTQRLRFGLTESIHWFSCANAWFEELGEWSKSYNIWKKEVEGKEEYTRYIESMIWASLIIDCICF